MVLFLLLQSLSRRADDGILIKCRNYALNLNFDMQISYNKILILLVNSIKQNLYFTEL